MPKFDEIDKEILRLLQKDGRMAYKDIAEKLGKAPATIKNRIMKMMHAGIIRAFVPLLNYKALGYSISAVIMIQAKPGKLNELTSLVRTMNNITNAYEVTGEYDVVLIGRFKDEGHLADFVRKLLDSDFVARTVTSMIIKTHREDPRIPIE
ncbi:MAG: Lrp/AsnC family transcriptional regulator [Candidatus Njordarchaeales archaeon]